MSENSLEHTEVPQDTARSTLREAERIWRRAAVRPSDRRALLAELSDELAAAGADDLRQEFGVPPQVIGIEHHADAVAERVAEVEGLREGVHHGSVWRIHRVQRFDGER